MQPRITENRNLTTLDAAKSFEDIFAF